MVELAITVKQCQLKLKVKWLVAELSENGILLQVTRGHGTKPWIMTETFAKSVQNLTMARRHITLSIKMGIIRVVGDAIEIR